MGVGNIVRVFITFAVFMMVILSVYWGSYIGIRTYVFIQTNSRVEDTLNTLVSHAQKANGFVDTSTTDFNDLYEGLVKANNLEGKIKDVSFNPGIGTRLNKGEMFTVSMTPIYKIGNKELGVGRPRVAEGVAVQYFKE